MFKLEFKLDNASFVEAKEVEVARILAEVRRAVLNQYGMGKVRDVNGNTVGEWSMDYR
jgi:hypothetical protein